MPLRLVAGILGAFYLIQSINWIARPAMAAEALGMPLLDGLGRSTQVGDTASFFLSLGLMCLWGAARTNPLWLRGGAMLVGGAALMRTLTWLFHDAPFATPFISVEVVSAAVLLYIAWRFESLAIAPGA